MIDGRPMLFIATRIQKKIVVFNDPHIIYPLKIQVFFNLNHTLAILLN